MKVRRWCNTHRVRHSKHAAYHCQRGRCTKPNNPHCTKVDSKMKKPSFKERVLRHLKAA